jgi:hypothetical protein
LVAAGCGGSSKTNSTTTTSVTTTASVPTSTSTTASITPATGKPLTSSEWIAKGDSICTRANTKLNATTIKTSQDFARILPQAAVYDHNEAAELSKLVPPTAMTTNWAQIIAGIQKFSEYSAKAGEYAKANNIKATTTTLITANKVQAEFAAAAKRDGFKVCSGV